MTKPKGPGAPTGNTNAVKPEKERAVPIHITVPWSLHEWLKRVRRKEEYASMSQTVTELLQQQMK